MPLRRSKRPASKAGRQFLAPKFSGGTGDAGGGVNVKQFLQDPKLRQVGLNIVRQFIEGSAKGNPPDDLADLGRRISSDDLLAESRSRSMLVRVGDSREPCRAVTQFTERRVAPASRRPAPRSAPTPRSG